MNVVNLILGLGMFSSDFERLNYFYKHVFKMIDVRVALNVIKLI